jgi:hypothetical protein
MQLKKIADIEWYCRYIGEDPSSFNLASFYRSYPKGISTRRFLVPLGMINTFNFDTEDLEKMQKIFPSDLQIGFLDALSSIFGSNEIKLQIPKNRETPEKEEIPDDNEIHQLLQNISPFLSLNLWKK